MNLDSTLILAGLALIFVFGAALYVTVERRILKLQVKLKSRKLVDAFEPDLYMLSLPEEDFKQLALMLEPNAKKKSVRLAWSYTTPSGKTTYGNSKKYSLPEVEDFVKKLRLVYGAGKERILGLNELYEEQLKLGRELNDGNPKIYCYSIPSETHRGIVKVGYAKNNAHKRIEDQFKTAARLKIPYKIHFIMPAVTVSGKPFMDHPVHRVLKNAGVPNPEGEWFACSVRTAEQAVMAVQLNKTSL